MLEGKKIVVFGFGTQGKAQALNLKDSRLDVSVYLRSGSNGIHEAEENGFNILTDGAKAANLADIAVFLLPDREQVQFYNTVLDKNLPREAALIFAHGLNIHYKMLRPRGDIDVILAAPLGQAAAVRKGYLLGDGVPMMVAVFQDYSKKGWEIASEYARAVSKDALQIKTTFEEEVETDLFTEQAIIVGGLSELILAGFDTLVEAGYRPEIAYFSTLKEAKFMMDIFARLGVAKTMEAISDTARYGALTRGTRVINGDVKSRLKVILKEIKDGRFKTELEAENLSGQPKSKELIDRLQHHLISEIHNRFGKEKL